MIKYNNSNINDWNYGDDNIIKVYRNNAVCYYKVISSGDTPTPTLPNYLRFVARQNGSFRLSGNTVEYSLDSGTTWTELASDTESPSVSSGSIIMWKATNPPLVTNNGIGRFYSTGQFDVEGNIMSLIYGDDFETATTISNDGQFMSLFYGNLNVINASGMTLPSTNVPANGYRSMFTNCTNIVTAPSVLPATTLADRCYSSMFNGCTSLTTAPSLPATTLANYCYLSMFNGCTSLTTAPVLSATTLANNCYSYMFYNCTSLNNITCLATDMSAAYCTNGWLRGVASSGTFTKAASMSWPTGDSGIPDGWTVEDYVS